MANASIHDEMNLNIVAHHQAAKMLRQKKTNCYTFSIKSGSPYQFGAKLLARFGFGYVSKGGEYFIFH